METVEIETEIGDYDEVLRYRAILSEIRKEIEKYLQSHPGWSFQCEIDVKHPRIRLIFKDKFLGHSVQEKRRKDLSDSIVRISQSYKSWLTFLLEEGHKDLTFIVVKGPGVG